MKNLMVALMLVSVAACAQEETVEDAGTVETIEVPATDAHETAEHDVEVTEAVTDTVF